MRYSVSAKELGINTSRLVKTKFLGHWKSAFKGEGVTFADIRQYTWGDPRKRIDRRTTAKKGELYIKEYEEERQLNMIVAVDSGKSMDFSLQGDTKRKVSLDIATLLAYASSSYGDQWGALQFDESLVKRFPSKKGLRSYFQFAQEYKDHTGSETSSVQSIIEYLLHANVRHALVCIVCDDFISDLPGLSAVTAHNDVVFLHCFDDYEITLESSYHHGLLGSGSAARYMWMGSKAKKNYQKKFEDKRLLTQQYVTQQGCSYRMIKTSDDPVLSLVEFFMKKSHHVS